MTCISEPYHFHRAGTVIRFYYTTKRKMSPLLFLFRRTYFAFGAGALRKKIFRAKISFGNVSASGSERFCSDISHPGIRLAELRQCTQKMATSRSSCCCVAIVRASKHTCVADIRLRYFSLVRRHTVKTILYINSFRPMTDASYLEACFVIHSHISITGYVQEAARGAGFETGTDEFSLWCHPVALAS
jgi:hypothetical protein